MVGKPLWCLTCKRIGLLIHQRFKTPTCPRKLNCDLNVKAYLLDNDSQVYLVFAEDAEEAGNTLAELTGCNVEEISVGGMYDIDPERPISISALWPYFTNTPGRHHDGNRGTVQSGVS